MSRSTIRSAVMARSRVRYTVSGLRRRQRSISHSRAMASIRCITDPSTSFPLDWIMMSPRTYMSCSQRATRIEGAIITWRACIPTKKISVEKEKGVSGTTMSEESMLHDRSMRFSPSHLGKASIACTLRTKSMSTLLPHSFLHTGWARANTTEAKFRAKGCGASFMRCCCSWFFAKSSRVFEHSSMRYIHVRTICRSAAFFSNPSRRTAERVFVSPVSTLREVSRTDSVSAGFTRGYPGRPEVRMLRRSCRSGTIKKRRAQQSGTTRMPCWWESRVFSSEIWSSCLATYFCCCCCGRCCCCCWNGRLGGARFFRFSTDRTRT
eukprot:Sspe_Gene.17799::Locus_6354_Transcript_8_10_Confidence_0.235_Length_3315::g.17799::m.17799